MSPWGRVRAACSRLLGAARRRPLELALALVAIGATLYVVAAPLFVVRYPPITDLPFHAAQTSILAHYFDPAWHFREQFRLRPLAVPYMSSYALGAFLMLVLPVMPAFKIAAAVMIALLPAGLAVLAYGMKKSPYLGLAGLGLAWCSLTQWGFLNFVGALGLFAMVVGLTLLVVDKPTPGRRLGLALALLALFFTHIFRFPFGLAAVVGTAMVMWPATRRLRPVLLPMVPSLALFAIWLEIRPKELAASMGPLTIHKERFRELEGFLFGALADEAEAASVARATRILVVVAMVSAVLLLLERRFRGRTPRQWAFAIGATAAPIACAAVFLGLFLILPMSIGNWWYVYPREATATVFIALAALPDLPRRAWLRAPLGVALAVAGLGPAAVVVDDYRQFRTSADELETIIHSLPPAPKLLYLVFDHSGSKRAVTPYIHLPAYVQAEKGGWLSFHFAKFNASPIAFRAATEPGAVVPPPTPYRWEWTPEVFRVQKHGRFFDWFLVRQKAPPDRLFAADPTIQPVRQVGSWWLYRRMSR